MDMLASLASAGLGTLAGVAPLAAVLAGFWFVAIRQPLPGAGRIALGLVYVLAGLTLFAVGLEQALFPLGRVMAAQLASPALLGAGPPGWQDYGWVYAFAAAIGFATTIAEPALIAVATKAHEVSGGALGAWGLRIAVGVGVGAGVAVGTFRIVTGTPLPYYIVAAYAVVMLQTAVANRSIIPVAYDSGGVATSTVTVPLLAALGIGLASAVPGRNPLLDGFGLIAFACLFPIIAVLGYAQLGSLWQRRTRR